MSVDPVPDWLMPPVDGFLADDLDRLPGLPVGSELIDGGLVLPPVQSVFHGLVIKLLAAGLGTSRPAGMLVRQQMSVILRPRQRLVPDVLLVATAAETAVDQVWYPADAVRLVVEVESEASAIRDRERKPQLYAQAGIRYLWRVEEDNGKPVVYAYELDPATTTYVLTGTYRNRLKLAVPYDIDVDLTDLADL